MNRDVLEEWGTDPGDVIAAKLPGFELSIRPRVNLSRSDHSSVFGALVAISHADLDKIYSTLEQRFGLKYFPEPVLVETSEGTLRPALCYISPPIPPAPANEDYVKQLAECVRLLGHPEWYAKFIESFAEGSG